MKHIRARLLLAVVCLAASSSAGLAQPAATTVLDALNAVKAAL